MENNRNQTDQNNRRYNFRPRQDNRTVQVVDVDDDIEILPANVRMNQDQQRSRTQQIIQRQTEQALMQNQMQNQNQYQAGYPRERQNRYDCNSTVRAAGTLLVAALPGLRDITSLRAQLGQASNQQISGFQSPQTIFQNPREFIEGERVGLSGSGQVDVDMREAEAEDEEDENEDEDEDSEEAGDEVEGD